MNNLQTTAEINWGEDEAVLLVDFALDLFEHEGRDAYHKWLMSERAFYFNRVFEKNMEIMVIFCNKFNKMTASKTNLYM